MIVKINFYGENTIYLTLIEKNKKWQVKATKNKITFTEIDNDDIEDKLKKIEQEDIEQIEKYNGRIHAWLKKYLNKNIQIPHNIPNKKIKYIVYEKGWNAVY